MGRGENGEQGACVIYGTPLENEEDISRRRAAALDKGAIRRQAAVWQQEARDTEGRRRFHGAFTGGFSAGYYNTVGSKEGWEPKSFKSSRSSRADKQQHTAYDYMDEEERTEMDEKQLGTANEFDTFGFTAAEYARRQATQETQSRPAIIPGPIPDEIIVPATESIGMKLLMKMGWRHGRAIGPKHIAASSESKREGRKAMMALSNKRSTDGVGLAPADIQESDQMEARNEVDLLSSTPAFVMTPKDNLYGLGFDPYKSAPEFREMKRARLENDKKDQVLSKAVNASKPSLFRPNAGTMSKGFGIGALEELGEEDEDVYASGPRPDTLLLEDEDLDQQDKGDPDVSTRLLTYGRDVLPGFKPASESASRAEWFDPPVVPPDYVAVHKFTVALDLSRTQSEIAPPEVPPPLDKTLVKLVEGLAALVARSGLQLEALSKEKNKENPQFQFLFGGVGSDYYLRKLWEERAKRGVQPQSKREIPKLDANDRGKLLGETPLQKSVPPSIPAEDRARLQATLQKTFMKPATDVNNSSRQPFEEDPAKQARFEQFMRDKYRGGLRKMDLGAQQMTEVQRAQELLEFETVAHAVQGRIPQQRSSVEAKDLPTSSSSVLQKLAVAGDRFTSGGHERAGSFVKSSEEKKPSEQQETETASSHYPKRTQQPWRPLPLLCKRFDLLDPYAGKPAPVKPKSRIDSLTLATTSESFLGSKLNEALNQGNTEHENLNENLPIQVDEKQEAIEQIQEMPVDLYKAIFSDDSDDDTDLQVAPQSVKQVDAANAALNRLVADDFLESLGKELGLEVPPPPLPAVREARVSDDMPKAEVEFNKTLKYDEQPTTVREARVNDDMRRGESGSTRMLDHDQKKNQARNLSTGVVHDKSKMLNEKTDEPKDHTSNLSRPKLKEDKALDSRHKSHEKSEKRKEKDKKRKHRQGESSEDRRKRKRREKKERHERHKSRKKQRSPSSSSTSSM